MQQTDASVDAIYHERTKVEQMVDDFLILRLALQNCCWDLDVL